MVRQAFGYISNSNLNEEQRCASSWRLSKARWQERLDEVEEDDVARLRHGYWAFAFSIVGESAWPTLRRLEARAGRSAASGPAPSSVCRCRRTR